MTVFVYKQEMMKEIEKIIGIGGGVGPMAGVKLHEKIIENTLTGGTDQDHLEVYHFSRSHDIPDRTEYLLREIDVNPAGGMFRTALAMVNAANTFGKKIVFGVPCNTFHAPEIFNQFIKLLNREDVNIQVLNMIKETGDFIRSSLPEARRIGLMSTTGTRKARVYGEVLNPFGFEIIEVPESLQKELHDSIYNNKWGIKAVSPVSERARKNFEKYTGLLQNAGAEAVILGCTEIPLALPERNFNGMPLLDPVLVLARALIREVDRKKLKKSVP